MDRIWYHTPVQLKFDPDNPKYEYITDEAKALVAIEALEAEQVIGVDIEASGLDPYTSTFLLLQIGGPEKSYVFDVRKVDLRQFPQLKELLESPKRIKLMHNGKFDYGFIKHNMGIEVNNIYDTMLAEGVLNAGMAGKQASLKSLALKYLNLDMDKTIRKTFENYTGEITEAQAKYSAIDTLVLFPIFDQQLEKLKKEGLVNIAKLEFSVTRVVAEMELKGIYIDIPKWRSIIVGLKTKRDKYSIDFQEMIRPYYNTNHVDLFGTVVDSININSQPQLMDLFNNRLKLNLPSTGDPILEGVNHPIVKILRDYRVYEKLISAFGESLLEKVNKVTGRLHPDFIQLGAATGRFACANPNLQQIPRNSLEAPFRECFVPAEGYKLVVADYSSMEMRILADLANDTKFITALKDGLDVHSYTAALMFNKEYSKDFKKLYPDLRQAAKTINFGLMYGMGPGSLARQIGVTPEVGKEYLQKYFASYPAVKKFLDKMAQDAVTRGWSMTPAGRKRWYTLPDKTDPEYNKKVGKIQREAKNHPIQGTNADVTKYALVFLHERMKKEGVEGHITHTVHDEIVSEVRADQAEDWVKIQSEEMVRAGELILKRVPVVAEAGAYDVWEH